MFGFRNSRGAVVIDGQQVGETLQCVHCGYTWIVKLGSEITRGFCTGCQGPLCGKKECMNSCTPFEARLDFTDALNEGDAKVVESLMKQFPGIKII